MSERKIALVICDCARVRGYTSHRKSIVSPRESDREGYPSNRGRKASFVCSSGRRMSSMAMKSGSLNVFIVYADQEARRPAVYAAMSADQAVALYRAEN